MIFQKVKSPFSSVYVGIVVSYLFTKFDQFLCNIHLLRVFQSWREQSLGRRTDVPMTAPSNFERLSVNEYCIKTGQIW